MSPSVLARIPNLVISDSQGNIVDVPELAMACRAGTRIIAPKPADLIPLPAGSDLFRLPGRIPVGLDRSSGGHVALTHYEGQRVWAVAAFMAPAHTALAWAAFEREPDAPALPLFAYAAAGWKGRGFRAAGVRVDPDARQEPPGFKPHEIQRRAKALLKEHSGNRLIHHVVAHCALTYCCPAARNYVLGRWEAPLPTAPSCNARCTGCLSRQHEEAGFPATQPRLDFVPTVEEIVTLAVPHLEQAPKALVSFGQGCEGEPLLQADLLEEAVRAIRKRTGRGTIHLNTNGSLPQAVERLCRAGLDSIRISLNSAQPELYARYFQPKDYTFDHVRESLRRAKAQGCWTSLNLFVFPGLTDRAEEKKCLDRLIRETRLDMIQLRNLNMDPDLYMQTLELTDWGRATPGVRKWMSDLRRRFPRLRLGYFNPAVKGCSLTQTSP